MTKLNWDAFHRAQRIRNNGSVPVTDCSSKEFSRIHLQPSPVERTKYLKHLRRLLQQADSSEANPANWLAQYGQIESLVPRWLDDPAVHAELARVKQTAERLRSQIAVKKADTRETRLREKINWLEEAVAKKQTGKINFESVQISTALFEAVAPKLSSDERLKLRIALRKAIEAIGASNLTYWHVNGYPNAYTLHQWLDLFESFAPELRKHPGFHAGRAKPMAIRV